MKPSVTNRTTTGGMLRQSWQIEKDNLMHPGSRVFIFYFALMCIGGLVYAIITNSPYIIFICGIGSAFGITGNIVCYIAARGQEKVIEHDPAFEAIDPPMQRHINKVSQYEHRKLMKKVHMMMPFLLFAFAAPIVGTILLIPIFEGLESPAGGKTMPLDVQRLVAAIACFAYFIGFIVIGLVIGMTTGRRKAKRLRNANLTYTEGIVFSTMTATEGTMGRTYRVQIVAWESDQFLAAISKKYYRKGERIKVEFDRNNPTNCKIVD